MTIRNAAVVGTIITLTTWATTLLAGDWPAFRGPAGNGVTAEKDFPIKWSADENIAWKVELPGPANGSPIVSAGRVFLTCAAEQGAKRSLYCFDRENGEQKWVRTVEHVPGESTHQTNPYCATTPAANGQRVVVFEGSPGLFCYDFDGNLVWSKDLGDVLHAWGYGSSPVIYGDKVLLNFGPGETTFLAALSLETGEVLWKTEEPGGANDNTGGFYIASYSTPLVANVNGKDQIICGMPTRVVGYDPESGDILWWCGGIPSERGELFYTSPIVAGDICVAMGGYKGPMLAVKLGGEGDLTETSRLWRFEDSQPQRIGSGVVREELIYIANAGPGTIQCLELETGKEVWSKRVEGDFWGSTVLADGRLYMTNQDGITYVAAANPHEFKLLATNELGEPTNSTPAFSDGRIFLRTNGHLYAVGK